LTTADGASGLEFSMDLQPLDRFDRTTPQGPVIPIGPFAIDAQGKFSTLLPPLDVTGDANPISGSDISATVSIEGFICTMTESICGTAEGDVTKPVPLPIAGSTFTIEKLAGPGMYPDPPILDCEGTEAGPPPSP
jgi:hypothetical protein